MSLKLDAELQEKGTKFRLFAQARYLKDFSEPETVRVSVTPAHIQPGPADDRMFVVDAINKKPYGPGSGSPQWEGSRRDPVPPGEDGHFDKIPINSRAFSAATMYATVRRVLDIWEDYFGHRVNWFFETDFDRLELIPLIEWDNAQSGYGFLEFGFGRKANGGINHQAPYCQNFDVLSHELGHNILFAQVGVPDENADTDEYGGFQESGGDLTAIVASLHFNSVVDHLLKHSKGNLFTVNELSRLGELPDGREIRVAFNYERMSTVSREPHDLSLPLTGAIFDIFVDAFQKELVTRKLITADLAKRSTHGVAPNEELPAIDAAFAKAYTGHEQEFKHALLTARDYLGRLLATTWDALKPNFLTYHGVARAILKADRTLTNGANAKSIRECFAWREISVKNSAFLMRRLSDCGMADRAAAPLRDTRAITLDGALPAADAEPRERA
ncbi:MAG TPA: hypothetical protein VN903_09185 [Polyangia bacterium]|jgi:hypothetical protein|nr:hypothetical protein [Polyangia bacterium]